MDVYFTFCLLLADEDPEEPEEEELEPEEELEGEEEGEVPVLVEEGGLEEEEGEVPVDGGANRGP